MSNSWDQYMALARIGHPKHLKEIVESPDSTVRWLAAEYGNSDHRDKLLDDPSRYIQYTIARLANKNQANHLKKFGATSFIKQHAENRLTEINQYGENY